MSDPKADFETCPVGTMDRLKRYEEITALACESESDDIVAYISGADNSEVAQLKASLAYTAAALGREIAITWETDRDFLKLVSDMLDSYSAMSGFVIECRNAAPLTPKQNRKEWEYASGQALKAMTGCRAIVELLEPALKERLSAIENQRVAA